MTNEQFKSLQRFLDAGGTLKESIGDYFFLRAGSGVDIIVKITPDGFSTVWNLTLHARIDPQGEALR